MNQRKQKNNFYIQRCDLMLLFFVGSVKTCWICTYVLCFQRKKWLNPLSGTFIATECDACGVWPDYWSIEYLLYIFGVLCANVDVIKLIYILTALLGFIFIICVAFNFFLKALCLCCLLTQCGQGWINLELSKPWVYEYLTVSRICNLWQFVWKNIWKRLVRSILYFCIASYLIY